MIVRPFMIAVALGMGCLASGGGAIGPRQPVGVILNPSIEMVDANNQPAHWILDPPARGSASAAPIEVSLGWGSGASERQTVRIDKIANEYKKHLVKFKAGASTDDATLDIVGKGRGKFLIGTSSLMPDDNIKGMRRDTMALLKQLDAPIYRWPGGNFVSGYNWKDGIGERDRRPPRKNPAWTGIEHNDFGMHEYFDLIRELNAQPFIALNAGLGTVDSAVQEVEYVNGSPGTPMGKLRAANGHREPFRCTYWAVGNKMSGSWQLANVPIEEFVKRHNAFSQALLNVDKSIKLVASGEAVRPNSDWDRRLLSNCAAYINLISKHFYRQDWHGGGLMTHVRQIADDIRAIADAHRDYLKTIPQMQDRNIRVSLDEWNYWYGPHVFGELGTRYFVRDALGIAGGINLAFYCRPQAWLNHLENYVIRFLDSSVCNQAGMPGARSPERRSRQNVNLFLREPLVFLVSWWRPLETAVAKAEGLPGTITGGLRWSW